MLYFSLRIHLHKRFLSLHSIFVHFEIVNFFNFDLLGIAFFFTCIFLLYWFHISFLSSTLDLNTFMHQHLIIGYIHWRLIGLIISQPIAPIDHQPLFGDEHASTNHLVTRYLGWTSLIKGKTITYVPKNQTPIHLYSKSSFLNYIYLN